MGYYWTKRKTLSRDGNQGTFGGEEGGGVKRRPLDCQFLWCRHVQSTTGTVGSETFLCRIFRVYQDWQIWCYGCEHLRLKPPLRALGVAYRPHWKPWRLSPWVCGQRSRARPRTFGGETPSRGFVFECDEGCSNAWRLRGSCAWAAQQEPKIKQL